MPYDLGDPVPLGITIKDPTGALADAGAVVLTITQPDATVVTPAVTHPSVGSYQCVFQPVLSGHYRYTWTATGANACAYADVFGVAAADPRYLISLAQARAALRKASGDITDDELLREYIGAVTPIVEDMIGPLLAVIGRTYTVDGGRTQILLPESPLLVTSVTETGTVLVAGVDYTVNARSGIVTRGSAQQPYVFLPGQSNVVVTYNVGAGSVPGNARLAAKIILRQIWQADQQGFRPAVGSPDNSTVTTPSGFAVPKRAFELLRPSMRTQMPGFA